MEKTIFNTCKAVEIAPRCVHVKYAQRPVEKSEVEEKVTGDESLVEKDKLIAH